jgi:aldehyde dehydrogenase (NAD+)
MELGGKNPLIVMEDADLDAAVQLAIKGGLSLSGQACTGTSRLIVVSAVKQAFTERLVQAVAALKIGSGMSPGMDLGPLASRKQLETVLAYIEKGKAEARLLIGGEHLTQGDYAHGYYVSPAVFTDVTQQMVIAREEIFGPVLAVIEASDYADDAAPGQRHRVRPVGRDRHAQPALHARLRPDIESGTVKINRTTTGNLVNAPFGGLKRSSTSTFRESGRAGLEFYTQIKTVYRGV